MKWLKKGRVCFVLTCIPSSDAWTICVGVYFVYYSGACDACEVDSASSGSSYLEKTYLELFGGSRKGQLLFAGIANSLKAVGMTLLVGIPICLMSAYTLSRMEFKGRKFIRNLLLITMVIPVMATIIPLFRIFVARQLLDNVFWLSLVYVSSYLPMITWLMSNYFSTIPKELEEAAVIDGCGRLAVFMRIFLPISYPIILSAALIIFLNTWNQFSDSVNSRFFCGDKTGGDRCIRVHDKGLHSIRSDCCSRDYNCDSAGHYSVNLSKVFDFRDDARICKRLDPSFFPWVKCGTVGK